MAKVSDITLQAVRHLVGYYCPTKITLAATGAVATISSTGAINFVNGGLFLTRAALATQSVAIAAGYGPHGGNGYVQPISTTVYYVVALDAAGAVYVYQGTFAGQTVVGQPWVGDGSVPDIAVTHTPIGLIKVVTNLSVTFTPGTTLWNAVTATAYDLASLPAANP